MRLWPLGLALVIGAALGGLLFGKYGPTKAERAADTVLADTTAVRIRRASQDSVTASHVRETQALRRERNKWRDAAQKLSQSVARDSEQAATLADIPPHFTQADSLERTTSALHAQMQVAARLRSEVIPALERVIRLDSLTILTQDATIHDQHLSLVAEYQRSDVLTKALTDLRKERRGGKKFLGFLPSWTDEVLLVAGGVTLGIAIGKGS